MTDSVATLVLQAAADASGWRAVLEALMTACGAPIGIISLREIETAGLSFPESSLTTLSAPLIAGIEPEFVAKYFDDYYALDPWTEIEKRIHPHTPYFMSEHLAAEELRTTTFFKGWLQPQRVSDCLVAEISLSKHHWVALNLLFDEPVASRKLEILAQLEVLLPIVRTGWDLSERLVRLSYGQVSSLRYLEKWPVPCIVLNEDMVVTSANTSGLREFADHVPLLAPIALGSPLEIAASPLRDGLLALQKRSSGENSGEFCVESSRSDHSLHVSAIAAGEDLVGKRRSQLLLVAKPKASPLSHTAQAPRIWEASDLTKAQAAIVKWVAEGGLVPDFALEHNIAKKTAYDHLFAARQKLDGMSARDIYTTHQSLLSAER